MRDFVMTSESVTMGHPDKLCDRISDAVVDAWLASGQRAGVNAECAIASGVVFLSVRAGRPDPIDAAALARRVVAEAGYGPESEEDAMTVILELAHDPALAPERIAQAAARQMVTAFGYACDSTPTGLPAPIDAAHRIARALDAARIDGRLAWLRPDAKAQVAVRFRDRRPVAVEAVALTLGTDEEVGLATVEAAVREEAVAPALAAAGLPLSPGAEVTAFVSDETGPAAHTGLTGRKTADDGYGVFVRQSGSALSGKDPSRIDRIADYAARHAARGIVAAGLAREVEVQLSYLPGRASPYDVEVDTYGTATIPDAEIEARLVAAVDLRAEAIAERLALWDLPARHGGRFYQRLASYGQMGRDDLALPWDAPDLAGVLG
ncbi:MAG: methionine adenosyltransferase domain-containing protein [Rhodosalinus sp.]|uniref:methionine adenosyltransferase domain-containing protein n=1 Tax=Rhodosalinus sp. TaxID=2047741 RepID=UPI003979C869